MQKAFALLRCKLGNGDPRPGRNNLCDFRLADLIVTVSRRVQPFLFFIFQFRRKLFLFVAKLCRTFKILRTHSRLFFRRQLLLAFFQIFDFGRRRKGLQPHFGSRFVNQVNRLIGQITVADIPRRKLHRRQNRRIGNFYFVVRFIFVADALENFHSLFFGRFPDGNRLKTPFQRRILFDVLSVFLNRGCADNLQFAACQRGL